MRDGCTISFAQLEAARRLKAGELTSAVEDYAHCGAAISGGVVKALIHRARRKLSLSQLRRIAKAAAHGAANQEKRGFHQDAAEFRTVLDLRCVARAA